MGTQYICVYQGLTLSTGKSSYLINILTAVTMWVMSLSRALDMMEGDMFGSLLAGAVTPCSRST